MGKTTLLCKLQKQYILDRINALEKGMIILYNIIRLYLRTDFMPRFFTDDITQDIGVIRGADAVHIGRSLRMRLGDEIILCKNGVEYISNIRSISDSEVICDITSSRKTLAEPDIEVVLYQAVPKLDKLEFIVQKATELGVSSIVPVLTKRCVSRPDAKSFEKKRERLSKIALEAAKQSGRGLIPEVSPIIDIGEAVERLCTHDVSLICYEKGGRSLSEAGLGGCKSVGVFIGSEGGFEESEAQLCIDRGITPIGLGSRILRCETAPIAAISIIMHLTGNM